MKTIFKHYLSLFIVLMFCSAAVSLNAKNGAVVLLQGKITDVDSGQPVGAPVHFVPAEGKEAKTKSNAASGEYQQVLASGKKYVIFVQGYLIIDADPEYDIPVHNEYKEFFRDLKVRKLSEGQELADIKIFEPNDSAITADGAAYLKTLKPFLTVNKQAKIVVTVSSFDSWFKTKKIKVKKKNSKGKLYTTYVKLKTKEQLQSLISARIAALKAFFKENRIIVKDDIYREDLQIVNEKKKRKRRKNPKTKRKEWYLPEMSNVKVCVGKVLNR